MAILTQSLSTLVGTYAEITAVSGDFNHQRAIVTDHNNAEMFWTTAGTPQWLWLPRYQLVHLVRAPITAPADTALNVLTQYTLPKVGAKDQIRVTGAVRNTTHTTAKTFAVKVGTSGSMADGYAPSLDSAGQFHFWTEMTNANDAAQQYWMSASNKSVIGQLSGDMQSTTKDLSVAGRLLQVTLQKGTGSDELILRKLSVEICGGGAA